MITHPEELAEVINLLRQDGLVALDTEFVWMKTYYPELALVQLASRKGETWLVDIAEDYKNIMGSQCGDRASSAEACSRVPQLSRLLGSLLSDTTTTKILHDSQQDLQHLTRYTGTLPKNIFDTRLAAGFCGFPSILSLQQLLRETLGIELPKTETRTDWCKRPLSEAQQEYARDDVRHLADVKAFLDAKAQELGTKAWMDDEMCSLDDETLYLDPPPENAWLRVKGYGRFTPRQLAILRELAVVREKIAIWKNRPRRWIMEDDALLQTAREATMKSVHPVHKAEPVHGTRRNLKNPEYQEAIRRGLECPSEQCPKNPSTRLNERQGRIVDDMMAKLKDQAAKRHLDPVLVASRAEIAEWVADPDAPVHPLNNGWRHEIRIL